MRLHTSLVKACWHLLIYVCMHGVQWMFAAAGVIYFEHSRFCKAERMVWTSSISAWEHVQFPSQLSPASQSCKSSCHNTLLIIILIADNYLPRELQMIFIAHLWRLIWETPFIHSIAVQHTRLYKLLLIVHFVRALSCWRAKEHYVEETERRFQ